MRNGWSMRKAVSLQLNGEKLMQMSKEELSSTLDLTSNEVEDCSVKWAALAAVPNPKHAPVQFTAHAPSADNVICFQDVDDSYFHTGSPVVVGQDIDDNHATWIGSHRKSRRDADGDNDAPLQKARRVSDALDDEGEAWVYSDEDNADADEWRRRSSSVGEVPIVPIVDDEEMAADAVDDLAPAAAKYGGYFATAPSQPANDDTQEAIAVAPAPILFSEPPQGRLRSSSGFEPVFLVGYNSAPSQADEDVWKRRTPESSVGQNVVIQPEAVLMNEVVDTKLESAPSSIRRANQLDYSTPTLLPGPDPAAEHVRLAAVFHSRAAAAVRVCNPPHSPEPSPGPTPRTVRSSVSRSFGWISCKLQGAWLRSMLLKCC
jgi:hypothetical protein